MYICYRCAVFTHSSTLYCLCKLAILLLCDLTYFLIFRWCCGIFCHSSVSFISRSLIGGGFLCTRRSSLSRHAQWAFVAVCWPLYLCNSEFLKIGKNYLSCIQMGIVLHKNAILISRPFPLKIAQEDVEYFVTDTFYLRSNLYHSLILIL